uniref:Uncharacterized protein n=1 Tax=Pithovirus LCPAC403 TaxID=2506596 RepID=A0A481ZC20_9VIRU|nr:MAG: uncharacterized protein LCPAC403_01690 [Pithovirus LCPAC403]
MIKDIVFKLVSNDHPPATGFLIEAKQSLILGPILSENVTIYNGKTPYKPYYASMKTMCRNMNFAIYCVSVDNLSKIPRPAYKNSFQLEEGIPVLVGGFEKDNKVMTVLRTSIKMFPPIQSFTIDTDTEEPCQAILASTFESGMIGSPVFTTDSELIGVLGEKGMIHIQNVLSVFKYMNNSNLSDVEYPTPSLIWGYGSRSIMRYKTDSENNYGIFVKQVLPDSYLKNVKSEDIITHIVFGDNVAFFDRYGYTNIVRVLKKAKLYTYNYGEFKLISKRRISFEELFGFIGGNFSIQIIRDFKPLMIQCKVERIPGKRLGVDSFTHQEYNFREPSLSDLSMWKPSEWYQDYVIVEMDGNEDRIKISLRDLRSQIQTMNEKIIFYTESMNIVVLWKIEGF